MIKITIRKVGSTPEEWQTTVFEGEFKILNNYTTTRELSVKELAKFMLSRWPS